MDVLDRQAQGGVTYYCYYHYRYYYYHYRYYYSDDGDNGDDPRSAAGCAAGVTRQQGQACGFSPVRHRCAVCSTSRGQGTAD